MLIHQLHATPDAPEPKNSRDYDAIANFKMADDADDAPPIERIFCLTGSESPHHFSKFILIIIIFISISDYLSIYDAAEKISRAWRDTRGDDTLCHALYAIFAGTIRRFVTVDTPISLIITAFFSRVASANRWHFPERRANATAFISRRVLLPQLSLTPVSRLAIR